VASASGRSSDSRAKAYSPRLPSRAQRLSTGQWHRCGFRSRSQRRGRSGFSPDSLLQPTGAGPACRQKRCVTPDFQPVQPSTSSHPAFQAQKCKPLITLRPGGKVHQTARAADAAALRGPAAVASRPIEPRSCAASTDLDSTDETFQSTRIKAADTRSWNTILRRRSGQTPEQPPATKVQLLPGPVVEAAARPLGSGPTVRPHRFRTIATETCQTGQDPPENPPTGTQGPGTSSGRSRNLKNGGSGTPTPSIHLFRHDRGPV